jgi:beta-galactosidase/beta-glucuronidase
VFPLAPPDYPRPALRRERWTDLCGTWQFAFDDKDVGLAERWFSSADPFDRTIEVPYPPESPASGVDERGHHLVVWYRRGFRARNLDGEQLLLHFGAVDYRARVWVNDSLVVTHEGGHTPFSADITSALLPGEEQVLTVRAEDDPTDLMQPRGKQDWRERPHSIWYDRTTGIWQPVWLEPVPSTRIASLRWTPDLSTAQLDAGIRLTGQLAGLRLRIQLTLHGELLTDETSTVTRPLTVRHLPLDAGRIHQDRSNYLWAPAHPNLVEATVTLLQEDEVVDEVVSHVGLRSVDVSGGRFRLNGRATVPRMVLAQNYWPESHLAAPGAAAIRREVELVKELGFTGVRIHQKVEDPRFVYWCDVLGLLVWTEMPSALEYDPTTLTRLTTEWLAVLERDVSAPSIVAWVPFNESWGVPVLQDDPAQQHAVRALYSLTKAIDPSRVVVANDGWEHLVGDVFGVHDYTQEPDVLTARYGDLESAVRTMRETQPHYRSIVLEGVDPGSAPLMITEFGGATYDPETDAFWNGYGAVDTAEALGDRYTELVASLLRSPVVAGYCYTQLTDTAQERNGLLYEDRRPKVDPAVITAVNRLPSAAVPADAIAEIQIQHAARRAAAT